MLEPLQVYTERGVELSDRSREHHGAPPGVFLDDCEAMGGGKCLDRSHVSAVGTKLPLEFLTRKMAAALTPPAEPGYPMLQRVGVATAEKHADLHSLRRIGLADGRRPGQWFSFTALQWILCHFAIPLPLLAAERPAMCA